MPCGCKKNKSKNTRFEVTYQDGRTRVFSNENSANQAVRQNPGAKKRSITSGT